MQEGPDTFQDEILYMLLTLDIGENPYAAFSEIESECSNSLPMAAVWLAHTSRKRQKPSPMDREEISK